jgi:hypothetical protein
LATPAAMSTSVSPSHGVHPGRSGVPDDQVVEENVPGVSLVTWSPSVVSSKGRGLPRLGLGRAATSRALAVDEDLDPQGILHRPMRHGGYVRRAQALTARQRESLALQRSSIRPTFQIVTEVAHVTTKSSTMP